MNKNAFGNRPLGMLQLAATRGIISGDSINRPTKTSNIAGVEAENVPGRGRTSSGIAVHAVRKDESTTDSTVLSDQISADIAPRLRQRDPSAIEELYDALGGRAFGLAYRVLGDGPAAEDAVQESFLWIWNNGDRIDPRKGRVSSLLLTIVHRRAIDALRARKRRDAIGGGSMDDLPELKDDRSEDQFDRVVDSLTHKHVRESLNSLSPDQRQVIELAYFEGLTQSEISDHSGIPLGTVKSRMRLGLTRLRVAFGIGDAS